MSIDIRLLVLDPESDAVVCERWLGGRDAMERAEEIIGRPPHQAMTGLESWSGLAPDDVRRIAEASYLEGGTPGEIAVLSELFPAPRYVWTLVVDS